MCGIAAVVNSNSDLRSTQLQEILGRIAHRGQPTHQMETHDVPICNTALGTNRLAIVSAECSKQPVFSPKGKYLVVFNGEIFNYKALYAQLSDTPSTETPREYGDTAVLAAAIERWGPEESIQYLTWEGAFIALDCATGEIVAGRDHLGIKPLYYAYQDSSLLFASEIKALASLATSEIFPVPPGTLLMQRPSVHVAPRLIRWWDPNIYLDGQFASATEAEVTTALMPILRQAVHSRVPEGKYAISLSGGVDSSVILALAHEANTNVTAYVLKRPESPDLPFARDLCARLDVPLIEVAAPSPEQLRDRLQEVVKTTETWEWHVVNHAAPMFSLMEAIRRDDHVVVLSGEGADELFCGYEVPLDAADLELAKERQITRLSNLHRTNCRRLDRVGMYATLECRVPFLDRRLTEFALGLHPQWIYRHGHNKWAIRAAADHLVGKTFAWRQKLSFARGAGYEYSATSNPSVFAPIDRIVDIPRDWGDAVRYPVERVFMKYFLDYGYGKARYLKERSV